MTPTDLARELGVELIRVRQWLRRNRPRRAEVKWTPYDLSLEEASAFRAAFAERAAALGILAEDRE